jgi:hypothetical protein
VQQSKQKVAVDEDNLEKNIDTDMQKDDTKIKIKTNDINPIGIDSDDDEEVKEEF